MKRTAIYFKGPRSVSQVGCVNLGEDLSIEMGAKISLSAGNTWDRVNRVIISQPRHDVDQALRAEADKVSLLV